jgi:hypothetical protein
MYTEKVKEKKDNGTLNLFDEVPLSRSSDISTSKEAEYEYKRSGKHDSDLNKVLDCVRKNPNSTWLDVEKLSDVKSPWKRLSDLKTLGLIKATGKKDGCSTYEVCDEK